MKWGQDAWPSQKPAATANLPPVVAVPGMVSQHVQIIALTCLQQLFEGVGGHHLSLKPTDAEELTSASETPTAIG